MLETIFGQRGNSREAHEQEPAIIVEFFLTPHYFKEDIAEIDEPFKQADVFISENVGWREENVTALNLLAKGELDLNDFPQPQNKRVDAGTRLRELIANSNKPILMVDLPDKNPILYFNRRLRKDNIEIDRAFYGGRFEEAINKLRISIEVSAAVNRERELMVSRQIKALLPKLKQKFPELKDKKELRILVFLGSNHSGVADLLAAAAPKLKIIKNFGGYTGNDSLGGEIEKKIKSGAEHPALDDLTCARIIIAGDIAFLTTKNIKDHRKCAMVGRFFAERLSLEQIRKISEQVGEVLPSEQVSQLTRSLAEVGVVIPKNIEESEKILNGKS